VPSKSQLVLMRSEQIDVEMSTFSVDPLIFSLSLTVIMIVKVVLFMDAGVRPTAGCAPRLESFYPYATECLVSNRSATEMLTDLTFCEDRMQEPYSWSGVPWTVTCLVDVCRFF